MAKIPEGPGGLLKFVHRLEVTKWLADLCVLESKVLSRLLYGGPIGRLRRLAGRLRFRNGQPVPVKAVTRAAPEEPASAGMISTGGAVAKRPIVFLHYSRSSYLQYSLGQAKRFDPDSTIHLLGDESNDGYSFIQHHRFTDYFQGAEAFARVYRHFSTLSYGYELFNFQRWFILKEFLEAHHLTQCLHLDSDALLYVDVTEDGRKFEHFDFTLSSNMSGCTFFLNRLSALRDFCGFLMDVFTKKDRYHYDKVVSHFAAGRRNGLPGGACDMTALQLYGEAHFGRIGEVAHVIDGSVYDPNINVPEPGFEMENGIKKITWRDALPYGKHIRLGRKIRFNSLHFQGRAKELMGQFCTAGGRG